jgi:Flp pilus assembly protein TadG
MARGHRGTGNTLRLFGRLRAFGAETLSMVGDHRGAVAFEFALISLPMLLLCAGIFGVGVVMIQDMELNFVVENAAKVEVAGQDGAAWAKAQLGSPVSVTATPSMRRPPGCRPHRPQERGRSVWGYFSQCR